MNTAVKTKTENEIATTTNDKMPALVKEGMMDMNTWGVIKDVIFPGVKNDKVIETAIRYCKARNLDIMKKPIHIVKFGDSETILPGISELRTTAVRTGLYAGKDSPKFGPDITEEWNWTTTWDNKTTKKHAKVTFPEWVEQTVYRLVNNEKCAFIERVYWKEAYATVSRKEDAPNSMWQERPRGQLAKCGEAASLRCAFPEELGSLYAAEEIEGKQDYSNSKTVDAVATDKQEDDPVIKRLNEKKDKKKPSTKQAETVTEVVVESTVETKTVDAQKSENENNKVVNTFSEEAGKLDNEPFSIETFRITKNGEKGQNQFANIDEAFDFLKTLVNRYAFKEAKKQLLTENNSLLTEMEKLGKIDFVTEIRDLANTGK